MGSQRNPSGCRGSLARFADSRVGLREEHKVLLDRWANTRLANRRG
jgi:hypothetical protein